MHRFQQIEHRSDENRVHAQDAVRAEFLDQLLKPRANHRAHGVLHRLLQLQPRGVIPFPRAAGHSRDRPIGLFGARLHDLVHQIKSVDAFNLNIVVNAQALHQRVRDALMTVTGIFRSKNQQFAHFFLFSITPMIFMIRGRLYL